MAALDAGASHGNDRDPGLFRPPENLARRKLLDQVLIGMGAVATGLGLLVLGSLIVDLWSDASGRLFAGGSLAPAAQFFTSFPSADPAAAGILSAWVGSLLVIVTTALIAIPAGVMAGLYLEEYAPRNAFTSAVEITVNNLAGVPSIIYGLLGLGLFVYQFQLGQTILTAGLTLALLILPILIVATREAVRSVPQGIREAALSVGATRWMTTRDHVLPYATPGIVTGIIIGVSRALGETAPLIVIGVPTFVAFLPVLSPDDIGKVTYDAMGNEVALTAGDVLASWSPFGERGWLDESFTVLPIQMFNWTQRPEPEFLQNAAAAGILLLLLTLLLNGAAVYLRYHIRKQVRW